MNLIKPSISIETIQPGEDLCKKIESFGRVCYKSEDRITEDSSEKFIKNIIKRGHESVLEHSNIILSLSQDLYLKIEDFSSESLRFLNLSSGLSNTNDDYLISGNIRAWREFINKHNHFPEVRAIHNFLSSRYPLFFTIATDEFFNYKIKILNQNELNKSQKEIHGFESVRIICDRGVSHELVRHRIASYSQESSRYCDYSGSMTFIIPPWVNIEPGNYLRGFTVPAGDFAGQIWVHSCFDDIERYNSLIKQGWQPQQARSVLPNSLKTEIIMTATISEWHHILTLRTAKAAHPQMREIMLMILSEMKKRHVEIFNDIILEN